MTATPITSEIRRLRLAYGDTPRQALADACQLTGHTIIALGARRHAPSLALAFRIARPFGVGGEGVVRWTA